MTAAALIHSFTDTAVIIDDGYGPARLEMIQEEHWAALRESENEECWVPIRNEHFPSLDRVMALKRDDLALQKAWSLYEVAPLTFPIFHPIFAHILASRDVAIRPLKQLVDYLENDVGLTLLLHPNIASAVEDIKHCKLIFLDFYLRQATAEQIIADVEHYADLFSSPVTDGTTEHSRFVFLISTALPPQKELEEFRLKTKVKTAFFKPIAKSSLTKNWVERELSKRVGCYEDIQKLSLYLDTFSKQISKVAGGLCDEIESIELHDLGILDSMRLKEDSENLGEYLSWLLSEALAAKIRASAPLLAAEKEVGRIRGVPFQGTLIPKPVLFDLYSEVAFSTESLARQNNKTQFADVFSRVGVNLSEGSESEIPVASTSAPLNIHIENRKYKTGASSTSLLSEDIREPEVTLGKEADEADIPVGCSQDLLLVISPACDLQRCPVNYEVLCVRGRIINQAPNLADLIGHHSFFGKGDEHQIKHLLRQGVGSGVSYALVEWYPKQITTIKESDLRNTKQYLRRAKLNELFGQEVKEEALSQVSRVGVPVDPSFSSALGATIRFKFSRKKYHIEEVTDDFVSGIFVSANQQNEARITLSEEFINLMNELVDTLHTPPSQSLNKETLAALTDLRSQGGSGFTLNNKFIKTYSGGFQVRFVNEYVRGNFKSENEIVFYPRGRIRDEEDDIPEAKTDSPPDPELLQVSIDSEFDGGVLHPPLPD